MRRLHPLIILILAWLRQDEPSTRPRQILRNNILVKNFQINSQILKNSVDSAENYVIYYL